MKFKNLLVLMIFLLFSSFCVLYLTHFMGKRDLQKHYFQANLLDQKDRFSITDQFVHRNLPFNRSEFYKSVLEVKEMNRNINFHVYGGVIPHHLLPSFIIADFFKSLSIQKVGTIVLIGPDHYEKGEDNIVTSRYAWETSFGILEPDLKTIDGLVSSGAVVIDENTVVNDHSIFGILPFIKYYIPDAKIVPILMSSYSSKEEVEHFIDILAKYHDDSFVTIASVDFSHYLNSSEAQRNDEETISIIINSDYDRLFRLDSDFLDSPASVASVMMLMQNFDITNMKILQHLNASDITGNIYEETTSYFSIFYY